MVLVWVVSASERRLSTAGTAFEGFEGGDNISNVQEWSCMVERRKGWEAALARDGNGMVGQTWKIESIYYTTHA